MNELKRKEQVVLIEAYKTMAEQLSMRHHIDRYDCCEEGVELTDDIKSYTKAIRKRDKLDSLIKKQIGIIRQLTGETFAKLSDVEVKFCVIKYVSLYTMKITATRADETFDLIAFDDNERATLKQSLESGTLYMFFSREEFRRGFQYEIRSPEIFENTFFN